MMMVMLMMMMMMVTPFRQGRACRLQRLHEFSRLACRQSSPQSPPQAGHHHKDHDDDGDHNVVGVDDDGQL